jgi:threonine synthase
MDILISSNLERFLYYANECDTNKVSDLMNNLNTKGVYDFKNPYPYFYAYSTDEEKTLDVIKDVYDKYNYVVDPHTAVAYNAFKEYEKETLDKDITVVVSTASPYKFPQAVLSAFDIKEDDAFKSIDVLSKKFNLAIPEVLNYKKNERTVVKLADASSYVKDVVKCFK